jgi:hypothetical protein
LGTASKVKQGRDDTSDDMCTKSAPQTDSSTTGQILNVEEVVANRKAAETNVEDRNHHDVSQQPAI